MFTLVEYNPYLGWRLKPNLNEKVDLVDVEDITVRTNSLGFWDREFQLEKSGEVCRTLFLGDSFAWGMGVREEERFTNLLQKMNPQWETLNFGVPGYGTDQALLLWQRVAHSFEPDIVVLTLYENDYKDNLYLVRYGRRKPYFELTEEGDLVSKGLPVDRTDFWDDGIFNQAAPPYEKFFEQPIQKRSRIVHWLAKNSDLVRFVYTKMRTTSVQESGIASSSRQTLGGTSRNDERERRRLELLLALVSQLAKEVESTDAKFVVVFAGNLTPQHQTTVEALKTMEIAVMDATSTVLAKQISSPKEGVYYRFSRHWTPAAHRAVALLLAETLETDELCETAIFHSTIKKS